MSKKVLVISSSPRAKGNSDMLCNEFINGAVSAGHSAEKIFLKDMNINYCTGCGYCNNHRGSCTQKDSMQEIKAKMIDADIIILATPVYFYTMCGQLKTFIDRNCFFYTDLVGKEFYYIMTAADEETSTMDGTINEFRSFLSCLDNPEEKGMIFATGVWNIGDIVGKRYLKDAYEMGRNI